MTTNPEQTPDADSETDTDSDTEPPNPFRSDEGIEFATSFSTGVQTWKDAIHYLFGDNSETDTD